jgi:prepilin-type processing-associated H-X9-DG protein
MHSWRVLLLPYLEQRAIYDRYRFDEPWDGPNNRKLHDAIVSAYVCPSHSRQGHSTAYAVVLGPETAWRGAEAMRLGDIKDGTDGTILVVEGSALSLHWMEPGDPGFGRMGFTINGTTKAGLSSNHPGGADALFVDGSVRFLKDGIAPERLRARLTVAGGEDVGEF